jgi:hypothetical protein
MAIRGGFAQETGLAGAFGAQHQQAALMAGYRGQAAMGGLSGGLGGLIFQEPKPKTYKDELQEEIDEWLEDIK